MNFESQKLAISYSIFNSSAFWKFAIDFFENKRENEIQIEPWRAKAFNLNLKPYNRKLALRDLEQALKNQRYRSLNLLEKYWLLVISDNAIVVNFSMRWLVTLLIREFSYHSTFHPHLVENFKTLTKL